MFGSVGQENGISFILTVQESASNTANIWCISNLSLCVYIHVCRFEGCRDYLAGKVGDIQPWTKQTDSGCTDQPLTFNSWAVAKKYLALQAAWHYAMFLLFSKWQTTAVLVFRTPEFCLWESWAGRAARYSWSAFARLNVIHKLE